MYRSYKKIFALALIILSPITTQALPSMYKGLLNRIKNPSRTYEDIKRSAKQYEGTYLKDVTRSTKPIESYKRIRVEHGTVNVGTDNAGNPIFLAYITAGNRKKNKGTIVGIDRFFNKEGYIQHAQRWAESGFYVVSFDPIGSGASSTNTPTNLDGVGGYTGYSWEQVAYFYRQGLVALDVNQSSSTQPLVMIGTDQDCTGVIAYANQFQGDSYSLTHLICETPLFDQFVNPSPCSVGLISPEEAQQVAAAFAVDPCGVCCALFSGDVNQAGNPGVFTEIHCPIFGDYLLNLAVSNYAKMPSDVFTRFFTISSLYNPAAIMKDITIPVLIFNGGIYQLLVNKQTGYLGLYGFCYSCQTGCTDTTYYLPFPNSIGINYQDASDVMHATRFFKFNNDVAGFITGASAVCEPIDPIGEPVNCTACPGTINIKN